MGKGLFKAINLQNYPAPYVNCQSISWIQVSYLAADSLFPEWKIWTQFLDECTEGLRLDGLAESHPIEVNGCRTLNEIRSFTY